MVLAVPLQGLAASLMWSCGPGHGRVVQGPVPHETGAPGAAAWHAHGPAALDQAPASGHAHDDVRAMPADSPAAPGSPHTHCDGDCHHGAQVPEVDEHTCSACAACCAMLALPANASPPGVVTPSHTVPASSSAVLPLLPPDGLERPPRADVA